MIYKENSLVDILHLSLSLYLWVLSKAGEYHVEEFVVILNLTQTTINKQQSTQESRGDVMMSSSCTDVCVCVCVCVCVHVFTFLRRKPKLSEANCLM